MDERQPRPTAMNEAKIIKPAPRAERTRNNKPSKETQESSGEARLKALAVHFFRKLLSRKSNGLLASEYVIGESGVRADLVICTKSKLIGIEIKSKKDKLTRLSKQLESYERYFDKTFLIIDKKHASRVSSVPLSVSILVVAENGRDLVMLRPQSPTPQPARYAKSKIDLLNKRQRRTFEYTHTDPKPRDIHRAVIAAFEKNYRKTTDAFLNETRRRSILEHHLEILSPFADKRRKAKESTEARKRKWAAWAKN